MLSINPRSCSRITLVISLASTISTLVLLLAALGLPWYTPLEFTSTTSGWDCHLTVLRSPIYGYKTCDCPATPLSFTLCDEHNFYQWRNCVDCREPGCACTQEQRVWNGTLFTNCLSIVLTCVCIVLLSSQFKAAKPGISSYWILMLFQCLNAFIILNCALFFLTINHAIKGDSGDWCEQRGVTIGACNSLAGSNTGTFFYQNHEYSFSTEWGIAAGWIMALTAGAFSIVATGSTFTFCVLRWKGDRSYETM